MFLRDSDFVLVTTTAYLEEAQGLARQGPFVRNGLICTSDDGPEISLGDIVAFPWKNAVEKLADIGKSLEND